MGKGYAISEGHLVTQKEHLTVTGIHFRNCLAAGRQTKEEFMVPRDKIQALGSWFHSNSHCER